MDGWLKQSTAVTVKAGPFIDDTGAALTSLTIQKADVRVSKNGGNMAAANADQGASNAGAPHDELGVYDVSLDATDTNTLGRLEFTISESGALIGRQTYMVLPAAMWDGLFGASPLATKDTMLGYFQLSLRSDAGIATDRATELGEINADEGSGAGDYDNTDIIELTADAAANFDTFFDNNSILSSKLLDDIPTAAEAAAATLGLTRKTGAVVDDASNSATTFETDLSESANDHWKYAFLTFTSGSLSGQTRRISGFNATTNFVTVENAFTAEPTDGDDFLIVNV